MKNIKRETYLKKLRPFRDQNLIKVITGIRRCGKSTLLKQFKDELSSNGVDEKQIQFINFEDPDYGYNANWKEIYDLLNKNLQKSKMNYIFLDEVQYIPDFERLLIGLQTKENVDLYVTGSNSHILSSELATLLSGRSVEIPILPFSFREYQEALNIPTNSETIFNSYLNFGGFPQAVNIFKQDQSSVDQYLSGVYETVVGRDILDRGQTSDKIALNKVVRYLLDNIGNATSTHSIATAIGLSDRKVERIIDSLTASFLFYRLDRLDVKGKKLLKTQEKYYTVDSGLRWAMLGRDASTDKGHLLENIIFLELLRRGNKISIGKVGEKEVDFVIRDPSGYTSYYQVAWTVSPKETLEREISPLERINDFSPRFLITMDPGEESLNGIKRINAIDWLLNEGP